MEKSEYEKLSARNGELETHRDLIQRKIINLRKDNPAIADYDATKAKLQSELKPLSEELGVIRTKLEHAKPQLDKDASHAKAESIPKILFSVAVDLELKTLEDDFSFDHQFPLCKHTAKLDIFALIPDSQPAAWNALIDEFAEFNGHINCPKCVAEKNTLRTKLREKIAELRNRMPEAEIADQEPRHAVSNARFNVHVKK